MKVIQSNVVELAGNAVRTSTFTGTGVDVAAYDGPCHLILQSSAATAGTTPTLIVKLETSDIVDSAFGDVAGVVFTTVTAAADLTQMLTVQIGDLKRFVRVVGTIAGTETPTYGFGVTMVGNLQAGRNASQSV